MISIVSVAVVVILLLLLPYLFPDREQHSLNEEARDKAPGRFATLAEGRVHYELQGAEDGPVAVLLNGIATPYYLWDGVVGNLIGAGFRVLRYDYFGRGFSDRPRAEYGADFFDKQLSDLLECLGIGSPVALVGVSLGGAVAVTFAERRPGRVSALVLLAPAGFNKLPKLAQIVTIPFVGHWAMKAFGDRAMLRAIRSELHDQRLADQVSARFAEQMRFKGFRHAMRSTFRNYSFDLSREYRRVANSGIPVLVI